MKNRLRCLPAQIRRRALRPLRPRGNDPCNDCCWPDVPPYSLEFRRQMVELVRAGRDPDDLAREFEPTAQSIRHWVTVADRRDGPVRRRLRASRQRNAMNAS